MRLLFDTHILIGLLEQTTASLPAPVRQLIHEPSGDVLVSVATLWEIAIKVRLGKLTLTPPLEELPRF